MWPGDHDLLRHLLARAQEQQVPFTWRELADSVLIQVLYGHICNVLDSELIQFVRRYIGRDERRRALDPWASVDTALLLVALVESGVVHSAVAITRSAEAAEVARTLSADLAIEWRAGDPLALLGEMPERFDLVVSAPSWNLERMTREYAADGERVRIRDSATHVLVLEACQRLTDGGEALFVLPQAFFSPRPTSVLAVLPRLGFGVRAAVVLPHVFRFISTRAAPQAYLVWLGRGPRPELFVGELQPGAAGEELLHNLRERVPGPVPQLGRVVPAVEFRSWRALVLSEEIASMARDSQAAPVRLGDIAVDIHRGRPAEDGGFEERPNAVYFPLIGNSPAVTSLSDLWIKPHNYAQVLLRTDAALAEYVAGFFNSDLGRKVRESVLSGTHIPKISKQLLAEAIVYLPPLEAQREVVDVERSIRELSVQLRTHARNLWERPREADRVRAALETLNERRGFEAWLETLPFPLASILWSYYATAEEHLKKTHLLHFFEAAAEFFVCLLLSAFRSDAAFFATNKRTWFPDPKGADDLRRSNFGSWVVIAGRLARSAREMLADAERRAQCLGLLRTERTALVEAMASKELYSLLTRVVGYRNDWMGHGGAEGERLLQQRVSMLQDELTKFRELFAQAFERYELLLPKQCKVVKGIYHYRATSLRGTRAKFREIAVQVSAPMEDGRTYLLDTASLIPLELVPLVRLMPSPRTEANACYFYNKMTGQGVRWVSYHFEQEAEIIQPDSAVLQLLEELRGQEP